jgi:hypothetical protein
MLFAVPFVPEPSDEPVIPVPPVNNNGNASNNNIRTTDNNINNNDNVNVNININVNGNIRANVNNADGNVPKGNISSANSTNNTNFESPRETLVIPVVIHVVYNMPEQNISDAQIKSQIDALNRDYRAKNADLSKVPAPFKDFIGDANIEFALTATDPQGKPTSGITRTETAQTSLDSINGVKFSDKGGQDVWDSTKYLNIWVCPLENGQLEYSQLPGGPPETDGVVVNYKAFGTFGTVAAPYNLGRSATHSIGHYLNLRHLWGDTQDCSGTDFVDDTPKAKGPNQGKPVFPHITCNNGQNGDMFMNFMDYVDDDAMVMFTKGQVLRMRQTLQGPRSSLVKRQVMKQ